LPIKTDYHHTGNRPLSTHTINRLILAPDPAQKLSPQISVELVGSEEVFGRYADGIISQPLLAAPR
jgi:hypothetical protein